MRVLILSSLLGPWVTWACAPLPEAAGRDPGFRVRLLDGEVPREILAQWTPDATPPWTAIDQLPAILHADFEAGIPASARIDRSPEPFVRAALGIPEAATLAEQPPPRLDPAAALRGTHGLRFPTPSGAVVWLVPLIPDTPYCFSGTVRRARSPRPIASSGVQASAATEGASAGDALTENALVGRLLLLELHEMPRITDSMEMRAALLQALGTATARHALPITASDGEFDSGRTIFRSSVYSRAALVAGIAGNPGWWLRPDAEREQATAPETPVDFDDVRLTALPLHLYLPLQDISEADDLRRDSSPGSSQRVRKVKIVGEVRRALIGTPPTTVRFEVPVQPGRVRLQWASGMLEEKVPDWGTRPIEVVVSVSDRNDHTWREVDRVRLQPRSIAPDGTIQERFENYGWIDRDSIVETTGATLGVNFEIRADQPVLDLVAIGEPTCHRIEAAPDRRPHLILISLDTVRSDRLGCYGYRREDGLLTSPRLDEFAADSLLFSEMRSVAPYTLPSHATMFTGLYPTAHGVVAAGRRLVSRVHPLVTEALHDQGYATAAFTAGGLVSYEHGFHHGFERYSILDPLMTSEDRLLEQFPRWGNRTFNEAAYARRRLPEVQRWIERQDRRPFFLFLHTYAVHNYRPPLDLEHDFCRTSPQVLGEDRSLHRLDVEAARNGRTIPAEVAAAASDLYDATFHYVDREIGAFLDWLRKTGVLDHSVVMITSDHGEEFGEHGGLLHGRTLYEEMLRIPLIVRAPGMQPGIIDEPVDLTDLAPTLLDYAGITADSQADGRSLRARLASGGFPSLLWHEVDAPNLTQRFAYRDGPFKLIFNPDTAREVEGFQSRRPPPFELFDLYTDPQERHNLVQFQPAPPIPAQDQTQPREFVHLRSLLERQRRTLQRRLEQRVDTETLHRTLSEAEKQLLQSLGYIHRD